MVNGFKLSRLRLATGSVFGRRAADTTTKAVATKEPVPDVMVTFGNPPNHMTFISHPGVMAIVKLLEMKYLVVPRAHLTQENVDAIRDFDPVLADKCQVAHDAEIDVNFFEMEHLDKPELLQKFLHEKELLDQARKDVLSSPPGVYRIPYYAREWERPSVPRKWRPEQTITADILAVEPDLIKDIELQSIVNKYLRKKEVDEEIQDDPIATAAENVKADQPPPENIDMKSSYTDKKVEDPGVTQMKKEQKTHKE